MAGLRISQLATSAGISAAAATALFLGCQTALFNVDVARVEAATAAETPDPATRTQWVAAEEEPAASARDAAGALAGWQETPGVGGTARVLVATGSDAKTFPPKRLLDISRVLSLAPTDGGAWLAYADATLALGYGTGHALAAYDMATLTARREGDQMYARALLVLREWEHIPEDRRHAAMGQLSDVRWQLVESQFQTIAGLVAAETPQVRAEIVEALPVKRRSDKAFLQLVGL